ncbi:prion-inhibition and propagation-domain-containing protein [Lasiosphaeria hispida]|uniref:Prion-inhibition and propagation-domain-containing protein n=1 Tax=Lasiosphaeria hispida TaxID=260671 RepID=A0AAJ0M8Q8_9PEZI|nr:prion-inhibition and propagation-domain-containing protein [Lasiosphaeria hispida]
MAEVAGLVLGAVGVAGVIGAFKDTIDLFNLIADSRHLGRDYEILETKLDIEKTLLLQWADRVKLLNPTGYDGQLDDPGTQRLVAKILECVATLLSNAPDLQQRYGLKELPADSISGDGGQLVSAPRVGDVRWGKFLDNYRASAEQKRNSNAPSIPTVKKIRWMIRDKQKFEVLIHELAHFTARLNDVIPITSGNHGASTRIMTDQDLQAIKDLRGLKILLEASTGLQKTVTESTQHVIDERCKTFILNKLWFRKITDRRESISPAHSKTLQWVLKPGQNSSWDDLPAWLRSGSGIYWISGKAGSGKSTLMKHLFLSQHLRSILSSWAGEKQCSLCDFFFMNLGTVEQKSQEGLSRTLLYQILSASRNLIPEALPQMWKEIHDADEQKDLNNVSLPSQAETIHAFSFIGNSQSTMGGQFCILIDGLDEFAGDYMDGITFIKHLAANKHIKVLVSSRPIPDCVAAFSDSPGLRLQDLNRDDISAYVNDTIGNHRYMDELLRSDGECKQMIQDIINKASGVFLWVVLACRSLLSGFADHDDISELRRRVDELPPELEELFQHMLGNIKIRHQEQGARLLRFCYIHQKAQWQSANAGLGVYALGLALLGNYSTDLNPFAVQRLSHRFLSDICAGLEGRLRSRCGGLLEASRDAKMACLSSDRCRSHKNQCINFRILFMHRTVFEFLNEAYVWKLDCLKLPPGFEPCTALSLYGLHLTQQSFQLEPSDAELTMAFLHDGLRWAILADSREHGRPWMFFDGLRAIIKDPVAESIFGTSGLYQNCLGFHDRQRKLPPIRESQISLRLAIEAGAVNYVATHPGLPFLVHHTAKPCSCCRPIMWRAVQRPVMDAAFPPSELSADGWVKIAAVQPSRDMLRVLLEAGCDPNQMLPGPSAQKTTWDALLERISRLDYRLVEDSAAQKWVDLIKTFLEAGADPQVLGPYMDESKRTWMTSLGMDIFGRVTRMEMGAVTPPQATAVDASSQRSDQRAATNTPDLGPQSKHKFMSRVKIAIKSRISK